MPSETIAERIVARAEYIYENEALVQAINECAIENGQVSEPVDRILRAWRSAFQDFSHEEFLARVSMLKDRSIESGHCGRISDRVAHLVDYLATPRELLREPSAYANLADNVRDAISDFFLSELVSSIPEFYSNQWSDLAASFRRFFDRWFLPTVVEFCDRGQGSDSCAFGASVLELLETYPVFARLLLTKGDHWVNEQQLFFQRLESDAKACQDFVHLRKMSEIKSVRGGLSDPHYGNQTVRIIEYGGDRKVLYKPKPLEVDKYFSEMISLANEALGVSLRVVEILPRRGYGWVEYVQADRSTGSARSQIYDAGVLLGLLHICCATDCHHENVIWTSKSICLIDCETILQPKVNQAKPLAVHRTLDRSFLDSCVRTGFVPNWSVNSRIRRSIDISGLGGFRVTRLRTGVPESGVVGNSDTERDDQIEEVSPSPFDFSAEHVQQLVNGFEDTMAVLQQRNDLSRSIRSKGRAGLRTRYVFRDTEVYDAILSYATRPRNMKDGYQFSICIDLAARAMVKEEDQELGTFVLQEEIASLLNLDIPKFYSHSNSSNLAGRYATYEGFFENSGRDYMLNKLQCLSDEVISQEREILIGSITAASDDRDDPSLRAHSTGGNTPVSSPKPSLSDFFSSAVHIAESIVARQTSPGSYDWWVFGFGPKTGRYQFSPIGLNLYDGRSGVALFFAALAGEGRDEYRDHAHRTFEPVLGVLTQMNGTELCELTKNIGLGAVAGFGSLIYAAVRIADYLDDSRYIDASASAISQLSEEVIAADQAIDIVFGNAGFVLASLRCYERSGDRNALRMAIIGGRALLETIEYNPRTTRQGAWHPLRITGFSHGLAGIAFALAELYRATALEEFLAGALRLIRKERSLRFSDGTYPDLRYDAEEMIHSSPNSWCHGLCGIVHSRLLIANLFDEELAIEEEVRNGISTLRNCKRKHVDHVCCGEAGIIDTLLSGHQILNDDLLLASAHERTKNVIVDASRHGRYALNEQIPIDFRSVGFFQGLSGIGYEMLRAENPFGHSSVSMLAINENLGPTA